MNIKNLKEKDITNNKKINSLFLSILNNELNIDCKILNGNFFLDSFNYFPITFDNISFNNLYSWGDTQKYHNFFTEDFYQNFLNQKNSFKNFNDIFILGSSTSDNYYRNIITFLPRIFFIKETEITIAIHRNSSNKFRDFISVILANMNIKVKKFIYLDDEFYKFNNSQLPQFFNKEISIKILNSFLSKKKLNNDLKIYVSRQNSNYRNLVNENDIVDKMKSNGFKIIDTNNISIFDQIELFSSAKTIVGPTGSALTNIVFASKDANVIEIRPKYKFEYETNLKNRYMNLCQLLNLEYKFIEADPIDSKKAKSGIEKFISKDVLQKSNYYKDLLIEKNKFEKLISEY